MEICRSLFDDHKRRRLKGMNLFGTKILQMERCDPNWIFSKLCKKHLVALPFEKFIKMPFFYFIFSFLEKLEGKMHHDG